MSRGNNSYKVIVEGGKLMLTVLFMIALILAFMLLSAEPAAAQCASGYPSNSTYCMSGGSGSATYPAPTPTPDNYINGDLFGDGATGVVVQLGASGIRNGVTTIANNVLEDPNASVPFSYSVLAGGIQYTTATPTEFNVTGNILNVIKTPGGPDTTVGKSAYGGVAGGNDLSVSTNVNVKNNEVNINNSANAADAKIKVNYDVVGGISAINYTSSSNGYSVVDGNKVTIDSTNAEIEVVNRVIGGSYYNVNVLDTKKRSEVTNNVVTVKGSGQIHLLNVIGGSSVGTTPTSSPGTDKSKWTLVSNNKVDVELTNDSSTIDGSIMGAYLSSGSYAYLSGNSVNISEGNKASLNGVIAAAYGGSGGVLYSTFEGNTVNFNDAIPSEGGSTDDVYGAFNWNSNTTTNANTYLDNKVNVNGGNIMGKVIGAHLFSNGIFDKAKPNVVNITASAADVTILEDVAGVHIKNSGEAKYGEVNIAGTSKRKVEIYEDVAGGAVGWYDPTGENVQANENAVNIDAKNLNVTISQNVAGGFVNVNNYTGPVTAKAEDNVVNITAEKGKGVVTEAIYGGYVLVDATASSSAGSTFSASNNQISLSDMALTGNVIGGKIDAQSGNGKYAATGNVVRLTGDITVDGSAVSLKGGEVSSSAAPADVDSYTGNTLIIDQAKISGTFDTISNFQNYNFRVDVDNLSGPVLSAANVDLRDPTDNTKNATISTLNVYGEKINVVGQNFELISSGSEIQVNNDNPQVMEGYQGALLIYDYAVALDPNDKTKLMATVVGLRINPRSGVMAELPIADLAFLNRAGDVVANYAIPAAQNSLIGNQGYGVYGTLGYSKHRYKTGSHVDVKGLNGQLGISAGTDNGNTQMVAALFFEFGKGEYDTYNGIDGVGVFHGNGDVSYVGGGVLGRFDFGPEYSSHPYIEASIRVGKSRFDFNTTDFQVSAGSHLLYTFDGTYYGFHGGLGYILDFNQMGTTLDVSAKYFFTEREASDYVLFGETIHLEKSQSSRIRAGARLTYALSDSIRPYVGGYYEYETDGESGVSIRDYHLSGASIKGSTGIGELGLMLESLNIPIKFELGIQGTGGERDGVGGTARLSYAF
jgi:hypothetical protein